MTTITIDRQTRDVLVDRVRSQETGRFEGFDGTLRLGTRDEVFAELEGIGWITDMLDALGWEDEGESDHYDLGVDAKVIALVREWYADAQESIKNELGNLEKVRRGDKDYILDGYSQAATIEWGEGYVARYREDAEVLARLRDRFTPEGAVA